MDSLIYTHVSGATAGITLIGILLVLALLILKEIAGSVERRRARRLSGAIDVALMPLFVVCTGLAVLRITEALR